ncbi:MAG: histidine kinase [Myxococcales bacterium]
MSVASESSLLRETARGLLAPRRLVPILLVSVPLVIAQHYLSAPPAAVLIGVALCLAFVVVAPVSWRVLLPDSLDSPAPLVRLALYGVVGAGTVLIIGAALPRIFGVGVTLMTSRPSLAVSAALFLVGGWGLGRDIDFEHRLARERSRSNALALEAERAQLLALRAHLDPHFLFNTLNCIAEWCREDGEVAEKAVLQLSAMLRAVLAGAKAATWPLREELELARTLFALHRLRDPARFELAFEANPAVLGIPVPPLILLPLAENSVTHGPAAGHSGPLSLQARREGDRVFLALENPGEYQGPRAGGSGLETVERRLVLAYRGAARLALTALPGRTRLELELPAAGPAPGGPT